MIARASGFAAVLLSGLLLADARAPAAAQDNDQIYAVIRRDAEMRAARRGEAPSRNSSWPGFQLFGGGPPREVPLITVRPRANPAGPHQASAGQRQNGNFRMPGGTRAYCVRLCDGFFFPAPAGASEGQGDQQATCNSLCPGTEVALYTARGGAAIEDASGPRGQPYARLATAFRFRETTVAACTCQGRATNGLARLPITHDFTLRAGDVVVTDNGVRVFAGAARFPYRQSDFVDARSYGRLPADMRRRVTEIQAGIQARDTGSAAPVARTEGHSARAAARRAGMADAAASLPLGAGTTSTEGVRILDITRRTDTSIR
ncbi:DUF2865 domain-containing protein [Phreatobacter stygius]|nr:DUF2865 domain-containing protein [Phreatobacter stygius]